jgi:hypothetical protein
MATTPLRLNDRHEAAARLFAVGMRRGDVARRLGYHPATLSHIRRSPAFQQKVTQFQAEIRDQMSAVSMVAQGEPPGVTHMGPVRRRDRVSRM